MRLAEIEAAALDVTARALRVKLVDVLIDALEHSADLLAVSGHILGPERVDGNSPFGNGDDGMVALSQVAAVLGVLLSGSRTLLKEHNPYAAAALVRQMVETEYLAWALAEDHDEAAKWLRSTRGERLDRWRPGDLRKRSGDRFRSADYWMHCELGGHPTPAGIRSFITHGRRDIVTELLRAEMLRHGISARDYLRAAGPTLVEGLDVAAHFDESVDAVIEEWRAADNLPHRDWGWTIE